MTDAAATVVPGEAEASALRTVAHRPVFSAAALAFVVSVNVVLPVHVTAVCSEVLCTCIVLPLTDGDQPRHPGLALAAGPLTRAGTGSGSGGGSPPAVLPPDALQPDSVRASPAASVATSSAGRVDVSRRLSAAGMVLLEVCGEVGRGRGTAQRQSLRSASMGASRAAREAG